MKRIGRVDGFRLYKSPGDRRRAVAMLVKRGFNYFVGYRDADKDCPYGLDFAVAEWVSEAKPRHIYKRDI